jgi:prophage tail gpP-like protein
MASDIAPLLADGPDDVTVQVGSYRFQGWQTVAISRSCESMPNTWSVTASAEFMQGEALAGTRPGQSCKIFIGSDLVVTGWIDRRTVRIDARERLVTISGRGMTRNLVDCSADVVNDTGLLGGNLSAANTLDLATRLSKAYGVTVKSAVADLGLPIPNFQLAPGETPYQLIESAARYAAFLVYEDETGALVLDRVGTRKHASGFSLPGNIEAIGAERSVDQLYSDYVVIWSGTDSTFNAGQLVTKRASRQDNTLGQYRLLVIVSEQVAPGIDIAELRANWELARRRGRSQAAAVTCDSWRDSSGALWTPNWIAPVEAPAADITGAQWVIGSVTFRKDKSGTHADLELMPPDAFNPEPNPTGSSPGSAGEAATV